MKKKEADQTEKLLQAGYEDALDKLKRSPPGSLEEVQNAALVNIALRKLTEYRKRR
jgi:hypothetical protein